MGLPPWHGKGPWRQVRLPSCRIVHPPRPTVSHSATRVHWEGPGSGDTPGLDPRLVYPVKVLPLGVGALVTFDGSLGAPTLQSSTLGLVSPTSPVPTLRVPLPRYRPGEVVSAKDPRRRPARVPPLRVLLVYSARQPGRRASRTPETRSTVLPPASTGSRYFYFVSRDKFSFFCTLSR